MVGTLTPSEEAQLTQTIEMFEVITQSQPHDYQSLEILKEAYAKLGREEDVMRTAKRIGQVYVSLGQLSSAILEYESILQRHPDDADVLAALGEIESKANSLAAEPAMGELPEPPKPKSTRAKQAARPAVADLDDGRNAMYKIFVEGKVIHNAHFEECWSKPDLGAVPLKPVDPFIQLLAEKNYLTLEKSLKLLSDKARLGFLPLDRYDPDLELARSIPSEICFRWCIVPFDRLSKSVLVATCNPFNAQAAAELGDVLKQRLLWYLTPPPDLLRALKKIYR